MSRIIHENEGFINRVRRIGSDGLIETVSTQKISDILDQNKRDQNDSDFQNGYTPEGDMKHVARVPLVVWEHWWREENKRRSKPIPIYGKEMHEVVRRKLNDPDNKFMRTGLGTIGSRKDV
jgi:hypothetical protein